MKLVNCFFFKLPDKFIFSISFYEVRNLYFFSLTVKILDHGYVSWLRVGPISVKMRRNEKLRI